MAQITEERKKMESAFMSEFWALRKAVAEPEDNHEYCDKVIKWTQKIYETYGKDEYVKRLLLANVDDIEKKAKQRGMRVNG